MPRTAALILGGGPAGSAVAIRLARAGAQPVLIERTRDAHDVVCGGFLGWDALARLRALGVDPDALGAHPIRRLRVIAGRRVAEAPLPHATAGLSRRTLDAALLQVAQACGAGIERGVTARRVDGLTLNLADGATIAGETLFLATGKHEVRGGARPVTGQAVGLRRRLPPCAALAGTIELHLLRDGYAGLLTQEDGSTNLCLSTSAARLAAAGGPDRLAAELAAESPRLGERLALGGEPWIAVAGVPYGWRAAAPARPGLFRVGDQAAVIASLAGDGVAIALASGDAAASAWLRDGPEGAPGHQRRFSARAHRPLAIAGALKAAGERPRLAAPLVAALARLPAAAGLLARLTRIG